MSDESIPAGLCQCGCGGKTTLARQTDRKRGYVRGEPCRFVHNHNNRLRYPASGEGERYCSKCEQHFPLTSFSLHVNGYYRRQCKPCTVKLVLESRRKNPERAAANQRRAKLKLNYGLSEEDVEAMLRDQGGKCAICLTASATDVDHDHETGAVRKMLCNSCNRTLGMAKDNPETLRAAARYLEEYVAAT